MPDDDFAKGAYATDTPGLTAPKPVRSVMPKYTSTALRAKVQGQVIAQFIVDADGTVGKARVIQSLDTELDEQALLAVRQWLFQSGELDGRAVPVVVTATLEFRVR